MELAISKITISDMNPRKTFDESELAELQASIEQYGILEPLIVRKVGSQYQLVAGERRFRAAQAAGFKEVPVVVKALTDSEVHEIMLIENLQRSSLAPLEEAQSLQAILEQGECNQTELAVKLGKSQAWVANRLRLLAAPDGLKDMLISRQITPKHIVATLPYVKYPVIERITELISEKLAEDGECSVSDLDDLIEGAITTYHENPYVLCIDDLNHEYRNFRKHLDFSKCDGCKHAISLKRWQRDIRYCPNRECWKTMIDAARAEYDIQIAAYHAELAESGRVDISDLAWGEYSYMSRTDFDITSCESCDKRRLSKTDSLICLDPKCYRKKQSAHTRERNKFIKSERERVWSAVDTWIGSCQDLDARWMLKSLIFSCNENRVTKALSNWGELKGTNPYMHKDEVDDFVSSLPEDQVLPAIVRVLCYDRLGQYESLSLDILERFVPAAVPFYVSPEASE